MLARDGILFPMSGGPMKDKPAIALLLSTYNGEKYLKELLDSLFRQEYADFDLLIRDDGSSDATRNIIFEQQKQHDNIVYLAGSENLGIKRSFNFLLDYAVKQQYRYYMFVDQDDIWLADKIKIAYEIIRTKERIYPDLPVLLHTDLKVVDSDLNSLCASFWKYEKINPAANSFNRILLSNIITGCTVIFNHQLAELVLPIPEEAVLHDWWLGLTASCFGRIFSFPGQTVLYRQHKNNAVGAEKINLSAYIAKAVQQNPLPKLFRQAEKFYQVYYDRLDGEKKAVLTGFLELRCWKWRNIGIIFRYKFLKHTLLKNLGFIALLILQKRGIFKNEI